MARKILIMLCALFVLPAFIMIGCDTTEKIDELKADFSADFSCEYRKMDISGSLSCNGQKLMNITFDLPETISGLSVSYKGSDMEISRENLICSADEAYIPESSFPNITHQIFCGITDGRAVFKGKCKNVCTYSMTTSWGDAVITSDSKGFVYKISLEKEDYILTLSDAKS